MLLRRARSLAPRRRASHLGLPLLAHLGRQFLAPARVHLVRPHLTPAGAPLRRLCTTASAEPVDTRPWPIRYWKSLLFASIVCAWINSLWVSNKTSKLRRALEDQVEDESPSNADELLELRALNDTPSSKIAALPELATKRLSKLGSTSAATVTTPQMLQLLRESTGSDLRETYILERMLMAVATCAATSGASGSSAEIAPSDIPMDIRMATASLMFLSSGSVVERLESMFDVLKQPTEGGHWAVPVSTLTPLLASLMATGQVPAEKQVSVIDEGKNMLGFGHNWYRVPPVVRLTAADWVEQLTQPPASADPVHATQAKNAEESAQISSLDLERFLQALQGDTVCIWGECHLINERKRQQKLVEEMAEAERNPSFTTRAWNAVFGGKSAKAEPNSSAGTSEPLPAIEVEPCSAPTVGEDFQPSQRFTGSRPGYVFKLGPKGQGYYKDA